MNPNVSFSLRGTVVLTGLALALAGVCRGAEKPNSDAFPVFDSFIKVTGQAPNVTGSDSAYARRFQTPSEGAYGIEALHYTKDIKDGPSYEFDGHALTGTEDYLGKFKVTKDELGSFEIGYKSFRTFYDGIGGFFPQNNSFQTLTNPELHTDRANFWVTAKIEKPNAPKFEFRYTNELRSGLKDSTVWGDTDFTGIPSYYGVGAAALNPPYSTARKIVANTIDLDERQQNWLGSVRHTVGKTDLEFEVLYNTSSNDDNRSVSRYPGELQLFPRQSSATNPAQVYPPATIANQIVGYDRQILDSKTMNYTGKFETHCTDQVSVFGGLLYSDGSADIGGDRKMYTYFPTLVGTQVVVGGFVGATGRPAYSYTTTSGETNQKIWAANLGLRYKPTSTLSGSVALKYEKNDVDGFNSVLYQSTQVNQTTGAITPINVVAPNVADRSEKSWVPEVQVSYTGIKSLSLYGSFDYRYSPGTEYGSSTGATSGGGLGAAVVSYDNVKLNHGQYKVGGVWTVSPLVNVRGEVFYKDHTNNITGYASSAGSRFILGYQFAGEKLTVTAKASPELTFTTRYIHQKGKMDTTVDYGTSYESMDSTSDSIGETIDWNPTQQFYVQGNVNVVFATISTGYPRSGGLANDVLRNADNNYINGSIVTGFTVDKLTDASLAYTFYRADNYEPAVATVGYGAGVTEYTVAATLKRKLSDRLMGTLKVGYFDSQSDTTGGRADFHGPMAYVSLAYAL
jgi:hypothetical protein